MPFIVKRVALGLKSLEKNEAHQRNQIIQQYWPLGNNPASGEAGAYSLHRGSVLLFSECRHAPALLVCLLKTLRLALDNTQYTQDL